MNLDQQIDAHIVGCQQCERNATRWWPAGDDGCNVATCDEHEASDDVHPLPLPPGTTLADYRNIQGRICGSMAMGDGEVQSINHVWVGKKILVPSEPDDWVAYCDLCGREKPGD